MAPVMISGSDMLWLCVMQVEVTSQALAAMRAAAAAAHPREACGILLGEGGRITHARQTANVHPAPHTHFEIDPQALIDAHRAARAGGPEVAGYFHSHPQGEAKPSATDRACAAGDGRVWAIIAPCSSGQDVRFWRDGEQGFDALPLCLIDG
jgi:proteasome lid subunit RPN8/RPN11